jgi:leucyl aminopeptidase
MVAGMWSDRDPTGSRPLWLVTEAELGAWSAAQDSTVRDWLAALRFRAERHQIVVLPAADGAPRGAVLGLGSLGAAADLELWHLAGAPERLPAGAWRIATPLPAHAATAAALGWANGSYRFDRYRETPRSGAPAALLVPPAEADMDYVENAAAALAMARDQINAAAADMNPAVLAQDAVALAGEHGASATVVEGDELRRDYPAVHAVGRAAACAPRLVDLRWGRASDPKVTLVGKGVCFDSGGLDLKTAAGMLLMKKDMGGAACVLALARMVMQAGLPVRLRVLIPAVENAVSGDAYRPGDVLRTRRGISVEVGNTDAEGRLVLCDALTAAADDQPDLIVDLATLTGAARVALGPDLPALYGTREDTVAALLRQGRSLADPLWPMPLWSGYDDELSSKVADLCNVAVSTFAGSIIGALFLRRFVAAAQDWLHIDLYAWNGKERPGRPVGAEPQAVRALYALVAERYVRR